MYVCFKCWKIIFPFFDISTFFPLFRLDEEKNCSEKLKMKKIKENREKSKLFLRVFDIWIMKQTRETDFSSNNRKKHCISLNSLLKHNDDITVVVHYKLTQKIVQKSKISSLIFQRIINNIPHKRESWQIRPKRPKRYFSQIVDLLTHKLWMHNPSLNYALKSFFIHFSLYTRRRAGCRMCRLVRNRWEVRVVLCTTFSMFSII